MVGGNATQPYVGASRPVTFGSIMVCGSDRGPVTVDDITLPAATGGLRISGFALRPNLTTSGGSPIGMVWRPAVESPARPRLHRCRPGCALWRQRRGRQRSARGGDSAGHGGRVRAGRSRSALPVRRRPRGRRAPRPPGAGHRCRRGALRLRGDASCARPGVGLNPAGASVMGRPWLARAWRPSRGQSGNVVVDGGPADPEGLGDPRHRLVRQVHAGRLLGRGGRQGWRGPRLRRAAAAARPGRTRAGTSSTGRARHPVTTIWVYAGGAMRGWVSSAPQRARVAIASRSASPRSVSA